MHGSEGGEGFTLPDPYHLAISKGSITSIYSTYILFLIKLQKRQIPKKELLKLRNDITRFYLDKKRVFYRYMEFRLRNCTKCR